MSAIDHGPAEGRARTCPRLFSCGTLARLESSSPVTWSLVPARASRPWNERLRASGASFQQFPDWNDAMQSWRLRMTYLVCENADGALAFVCVQGLGFGRARVGIVREGPIWLRPLVADATDACLRALAERLRELGFVVVCFAHRDAELLARLERVAPSTREVLIPFTVDDREALLVPLADADEAQLAAFAPVARRDIRRASPPATPSRRAPRRAPSPAPGRSGRRS
jgi:hypothetical protein